jgi:ATP-dependent Lon protease
LVAVPDLAIARKTLIAEFPYADRLIDILLADLAGREHVKLRPTLIVGAPGCGKTRFIRKVASALSIYVGRYDGAGAEDNVFGGTARRWSSGEPCWPITVIRAAGHANPCVHVDEIDKSADNNRNGSLQRALLPMLEIESSARFPDPYIQFDVDISKVSFLLTANDDTVLHATLKDRLRILRMPPITVEHVPACAAGIVLDLAAERGLDGRWVRPLDGDEIEIAQRMLGDGSVRRLRAIVERLLAARENQLARH